MVVVRDQHAMLLQLNPLPCNLLYVIVDSGQWFLMGVQLCRGKTPLGTLWRLLYIVHSALAQTRGNQVGTSARLYRILKFLVCKELTLFQRFFLDVRNVLG